MKKRGYGQEAVRNHGLQGPKMHGDLPAALQCGTVVSASNIKN